MDSIKYRIPVSILMFSIIGYLIGIFMLFNDPERSGDFNYLNTQLWLLYLPAANLGGFTCDYILFKLNKILPWKQFMFARFSAGYFASLLVVGIIIFIVSAVFQHSLLNIDLRNYANELQLQLLLKLLVILAFTLLVYNLLHLSLYSYRNYFVNSLKIKKVQREQMDLHIEALKNQLTPHYLFNNLNTISSLISKDKQQADKYIRSFVNSCRFIIENSRKVLISLRQELDFVNSYLYLMEIRFQHMIKAEIEIPDSSKGLFLPPLSLQMLVENAIKHNTLNVDEPLLIKIFVDKENFLIIENKLTKTSKYNGLTDCVLPKTINYESTKIGIQNIKMRYAYITDKAVQIEKTDYFSVKIPLINSKEANYETNFT